MLNFERLSDQVNCGKTAEQVSEVGTAQPAKVTDIFDYVRN